MKRTSRIMPILKYTVSPSLMAAFLFTIPATRSEAADFQGSLNSVVISDAASSNQPPVAIISYTKDNDTYTFDGSSSNDSDGTITALKWELGDGTTSQEQSFQYTSTSTDPIIVTLSVVDDSENITIVQEEIRSITNLIPNADNIQSTGWMFRDLTAVSAATWTNDGSDNAARLSSPTFSVTNGSTYTLTVDYISADDVFMVRNTNLSCYNEGRLFPEFPAASNWTTITFSCTANNDSPSADVQFYVGRDTINTNSGSIQNLVLTED